MLNLTYLERLTLPTVDCVVSARDAMLYALSIGLGPTEPGQDALAHVYEGAPGGLRAFATLPLVVGDPGPWWHDGPCGVGPGGPLHGEQSLRIYADIPLGVALRAQNRIVQVRDCTGGHGAITVERSIRTAQDGILLAVGHATLLCRGDGGFGAGFVRAQAMGLPAVADGGPDGGPDAVFEVAVAADAALLYRLNGDANPLHADPAAARAAGFARPILHGLASLAMVVAGLRRYAPQADVQRLATRFVGPVYPGDRLAVEVWNRGQQVYWRASVAGRAVMNQGVVQLAAG